MLALGSPAGGRIENPNMEHRPMKRRQFLAGMMTAAAAPAALALLGASGPNGGGWFAETAFAATNFPPKYPRINKPGIQLGVYDPYGNFKDYPGVAIEHLFLPWQDVELSTLYEADSYAKARGRSLLISLEPWSWSGDWRLTPNQLRDAILGGQYDATIASISQIIGELNSPVTVRWAQEMEDTTGRFSWAGWKPSDYIAAYRKFYELSRSKAPGAKYMWSPKGNKNLADYYPGDAYADVIGLSIFGLQKYDRDKYGRDRSFAEHLKPGYDAASRFGKPIVVAELGYSGDEEYVSNWANTVTALDPQFPQLTAVVYFNDKEVHAWPDNYGLPDWRVTERTSS
jgi:beta-mannanase